MIFIFLQIHRILRNSPADKDGRLKKGDRILAINGLSMKGLTHGESVTVLKENQRIDIELVITRSKSIVTDTLTKSKKLGSLNSLIDSVAISKDLREDKSKIYHKMSRSLDLDFDSPDVKGLSPFCFFFG